jgi:hypothetical protein
MKTAGKALHHSTLDMTSNAHRSATGTRRFMQLFFEEKQLAEMIYEAAQIDPQLAAKIQEIAAQLKE